MLKSIWILIESGFASTLLYNNVSLANGIAKAIFYDNTSEKIVFPPYDNIVLYVPVNFKILRYNCICSSVK